MKYQSYTVYDEDDVFQQYTAKRKKGNTPNDLLEQPIIDALIGDIDGKKILDIGCGDGAYGKELLKRGALHYHGIDGSENMIHLAKASTQGLSATIEKQSVEDFALRHWKNILRFLARRASK